MIDDTTKDYRIRWNHNFDFSPSPQSKFGFFFFNSGLKMMMMMHATVKNNSQWKKKDEVKSTNTIISITNGQSLKQGRRIKQTFQQQSCQQENDN